MPGWRCRTAPTARRYCIALLALGAGCTADGPPLAVASVAPAVGYADRPVRLVISGGGFVPSYELDPETGQRRRDLTGFSGTVGDAPRGAALIDFAWRSTEQLEATLPPGLPAGHHGLRLQDGRGQSVELPNAFESLGIDRTPPHVSVVSLDGDRPLAPGLVARLLVQVTDRPGRLRQIFWDARGAQEVVAAGDCPIAAAVEEAECLVMVAVPLHWREGDVLALQIVARDDAPTPNTTVTSLAFVLRARPTISSVAPLVGGTDGGTELVVRGAGFLPGTKVFVGRLPLVPAGGIIVDDGTITGRTPAQPQGDELITVQSPTGEAEHDARFRYRLPPQISVVDPPSGEPDGGTPVLVRGQRFGERTLILFGDRLEQAVPLVRPVFQGEDAIRGLTPPGRGTTNVWAFDSDLGWTRLSPGYSWR